MSERLEAIRKRSDAASAGPWHVDEFSGQYTLATAHLPAWGKTRQGHKVAIVPKGGPHDEANMAFILCAREDVPWLLAQIAALEAEMKALRAVAEAGRVYRAACATFTAAYSVPPELTSPGARTQQLEALDEAYHAKFAALDAWVAALAALDAGEGRDG